MSNRIESFAPEKLLKAWLPFHAALGISTVRTAKDYKKASKIMFQLLDVIGEDETHPLCGVLDYVTAHVAEYEDKHYHIPDAEPRAMLKFLMEQNDLKQTDLKDILPASRVSEILNGKREISKAVAKKLAVRFNMNVSVFI